METEAERVDDESEAESVPEAELLLASPQPLLNPLPSAAAVDRSCPRRREFMKKFATVVGSSFSCCDIVSCISRDGRFVSLKIA